MSLTAGTRLGPYEIQSQLGAGGMGEVYKATDTRLDRTVAIKVLLAQLADDPDLRQRFEREAKTKGDRCIRVLMRAAKMEIPVHTDQETPATVLWTGLEASTRAYARIVDEVNTLELSDLQRPEEP